MTHHWKLVLVYISVSCLLAKSETTQSTSDDDSEHSSYGNDILRYISSTVKFQKIKNNNELDTNYPFDTDINNHITIETNNIDDIVQGGTEQNSNLHDYLTKDQYQLNRLLLEVTLQKVDKELEDGRRRRHHELAKQALIFDSPFQGCSKDPYPSSESKTIKTYEVNLDAPPEDRWNKVVQQKSAQIKKLTDFLAEWLGPIVMSVVDTAMTWLHYSLPPEYYRELNGISTAAGVSVARVTLYNVFYEIFTVCTSIVLEANDGKIYHGRNLDFGLVLGWNAKNHTWFVTELLKPLIVKVDFMKNGRLLYSAVTYAGYTGILTGVKKNTFSLTINERFKLNGGYVGLAEWILGVRDSSWLGLLTRRVMESAVTYEQAQNLLAHTPLVAPAYFILAGNTSQQGSIITRGRRDADIWQLGSRHKKQKGSWYLVETNFDHWKETPFYDLRRQYAVQCMDETGRQKPLETLYRVLSTKPVLNKETTLTAVMDVREGLLQVWERDCPDPCWPL